MTDRRSRVRTFFAAVAFPVAALVATAAWGQEAEPSTRDAAKHFQRGVALYGEADYRAALVEFKRAYSLAPNTAVLYNVGETQYQLQDYAGALSTFRRFLAESGPNEGHRAEIENNVEVLRARVGHVAVTTVPAGADVTIDDQPVGKTPLDAPVLVSIGHRKVAAAIAGRAPVVRYIDVAADDNVSLTLQLPAPVDAAPVAAQVTTPAPAAAAPASPGSGAALRTVGWVATGAFAAGAITFGVLANKASNDLKAARNTYPTTAATLGRDANLTTTYSIVADSLTAAAIVVGGITLYSTLSSSSSSSAPARGSTGGTRVVLGPGSARFETTF